MALTFIGDQNAVAGTTSVTAPDPEEATTWPEGETVNPGDHVFIPVAFKRPSSANVATPSGWTLIGSATVGSGSNGAGTGPVGVRLFYQQVPVGGLTLPTLTLTGTTTGAVIMAGSLVYRGDEGTTGVLESASTSGTGGMSGSQWLIAGSSDIGVVTGDDLVCVGGIAATGPNVNGGNGTLTTPGVTYDSTTMPWSAQSGNGDDVRSFVFRSPATSGTSTGAPVFTVTPTTTSGLTGGALFVRLREQAPEPPGSVFDLTNWKLTLPTGSTEADEVQQPTLATYADANFYLDSNNLMMLVAPVLGETTPGSDGTRCEMREMQNGTEASWSPFDSGVRELTVSMRPDPTGATPREEMIVAQIHAGSNPAIYLAAEYHVSPARIRVFKDNLSGGSSGVGNMLEGITPDDEITVRIRVENETVNVYGALGGPENLPPLNEPDFSYSADTDFADTEGWYFKTGAYNKSETIDVGAGGESHNIISFLDLVQGGATNINGSGSASFTFSATASGVRGRNGTAVASFVFSATALGIIDDNTEEGAAAADFGFSATATGRRETFGSASATLGFSGAISGIGGKVGTASASLTFSASASGQVGTSPGVPFLQKFLGQNGRFIVECAWGADINSDPGTWTWTDITKDVRHVPGISVRLGRADEASTSQPAQCSMVLTNTNGKYSLGGQSPRYPFVRRSMPIRVQIDPADGSGFRSAFLGYADGFTPKWDDLHGKIPVVELSASGTLRRLAQGNSPIQSAFRREMTNSSTVVAYWPMEEGKNATYAPAVRGGSPMTFAGTPDWTASDDFNCSEPLPFAKDAHFNCDVYPYEDTGQNQARFLLLMPEAEDFPDGLVLAHFHTTGSIARWDITYEVFNGFPAMGLFRYYDSGEQEGSDIIGFGINAIPGRMSLELRQDGNDIVWRMGHKDAFQEGSGAGYFEATIPDETVGVFSHIELNPHSNLGDVVFGHVTIENEINSLFTATDALVAHVGDRPAALDDSGRIQRLCDQYNLPLTIYGNQEPFYMYDELGPQLPEPILDLLHECETADQGQLWDGRDPGLSYTTRRRRELSTVSLTIDASQYELDGSFAPVDDDQRTRNRVSATRLQGVTSTYEDTDGPLGVSSIGIYDSSLTVNTNHDLMTTHYASWQVHLGTVEGYRYPTVTIDARQAPDLMGPALDVVPGHRIDIINVDTVLTGFPMDHVSLIVEGIGHEISNDEWRITFQCSPWDPWGVGIAAATTGETDDRVLRADTSGSFLASSASAGATSISVTTPAGPRWTRNSDDYPLMLSVGGIPVEATACSGTGTTQTFTIEPLPFARSSNAEVKLYNQRPLGL